MMSKLPSKADLREERVQREHGGQGGDDTHRRFSSSVDCVLSKLKIVVWLFDGRPAPSRIASARSSQGH